MRSALCTMPQSLNQWLQTASILSLAAMALGAPPAYSKEEQTSEQKHHIAGAAPTDSPSASSTTPLSLALSQAANGDIDSADAAFKRISEAMADGPDAVCQLDVLPSWAQSMASHNRPKEAELLYLRAITIAQKHLTCKDVRLSQLGNKLAKLQYEQGAPKSALKNYKTALAYNEMLTPRNYSSLITSLLGIADSSFKSGAINDANLYYQRTLKESERGHLRGSQAAADALVGMANICAMQSKFSAALPLYEKALAKYKLLKPVPVAAVANVQQNTANLYVLSGNYVFAEKLYKDCIKKIAGLPKSDRLMDVAQHNLVQLYILQKRNADTELLYRQIVKRDESSKSCSQAALIGDMAGLAVACASQGKTAEANRLCEQIMTKWNGKFAATNAPALEKLAKVCASQRNRTYSTAFYNQANEIYKKTGNTKGALRTLLALANQYDEAGNYQQAFLKYEEALPLCSRDSRNLPMPFEKIANRMAVNFLTMKRSEGALANGAPITLSKDDEAKGLTALPKILHETAANHYNEGKYLEAARIFQQAAEIQQVLKGADDPGTIKSLIGRANSEYLCGLYPAAAEHYEQALQSCQRSNGAESTEVANLMTGMACVFAEQKKYKQAEDMYSRAAKIFRRTSGWESADEARCIHGLASLYYDQGQFDNAEVLFKKTIAIRERLLGKSHPALASSIDGLAHLYDKKGDYRQAELLFSRSLRILQGRLDAQHPLLAENMTNLADVYRKQGRYIDAEPLYKLALKTYEGNGEFDRSDYAACVAGYTRLLGDTQRLDEATKIASKARTSLAQRRSRTL